MSTETLPIAIVSGPVGVGKTSVGGEISHILERRAIPHTFIDFDQLRYTFPRPTDDSWGNKLAFDNLESIWNNCLNAGSLNLVISYVVEDENFITKLTNRISSSKSTTFQLSAKLETLHSRIEQREIGSGLDWHKKRASELLTSLSHHSTPCDHRIRTDNKLVSEIANEIVNIMHWRQ